MKIITILGLCLTASLSFAHSTILDKTNDDAFTYDYSGLCADIPNCYPSMKNPPEIDDNSQFPPIPQRIGNSVATYGASWSDFEFVIVGADGRQIINSNKKIDEYEAIYNKYSNLGFSSEADANAYFNIQILSSGNYQHLGSISWISNFNLSINEETLFISPSQSHFIMPLDTTIAEHFIEIDNPNIFHTFLIEDIKNLHQDEKLYANTSLIIPRVFERLSYGSKNDPSRTQIYFHSQEVLNIFPKCPEIELENKVNIFQTNKNIPIKFIETRKLSKTNFYDFDCPITASTDEYDLINTLNHESPNVYIQKIKTDNNSIKYQASNINRTDETILICSEMPKTESIFTKNGCDKFRLAPSSSIEININ